MATDQKLIDSANRASLRMADRTTPFINDCWYVAGFSSDFSRDLKARTILGRPLVLFRTQSGLPVALSDRCIHRSFPLSQSALDGDTVICGYHGLRFGVDGACRDVPSQPAACPKGIGVRSYPLKEQGPVVWIWMGNGPPDADLPIGSWLNDPLWPASQQYHHLAASYVALHENLLDLTHLSFLHADTFGTPDFASAPYSLELDEENGHFKLIRSASPTRLPPVWAQTLGLSGVDAARITTSEFIGPSAHLVTGHFYALADAASPPDTRIITAHCPTPETATTTHYFIHHARNYAINDDAITAFMHDSLSAAFLEDVVGLAQVEAMIAASPLEDRFEISFAADRAAVAMRRWLFKKAQG